MVGLVLFAKELAELLGQCADLGSESREELSYLLLGVSHVDSFSCFAKVDCLLRNMWVVVRPLLTGRERFVDNLNSLVPLHDDLFLAEGVGHAMVGLELQLDL
jgi:hypothetical protein